MKKASTDHRSRVTKLLIRKAFILLLKEKQIENISIKELCEKAEINRGTFYTHYTDIYDLLNEIEADLQGDFEKVLEPLNYIDKEQLISETLIMQFFSYLKENSDLYILTLGGYGDRAFALKLINLGTERFAEVYIKHFNNISTKKVEYFCTYVSSGCIGVLRKWAFEGMSISTEEVAKMVEDIMLMGIRFLE